MRRRRRNPTELERLIDQVIRLEQEILELEPSDHDWALEGLEDEKKTLLRDLKQIEKKIQKRKAEIRGERELYKQKVKELQYLEGRITKLKA